MHQAHYGQNEVKLIGILSTVQYRMTTKVDWTEFIRLLWCYVKEYVEKIARVNFKDVGSFKLSPCY